MSNYYSDEYYFEQEELETQEAEQELNTEEEETQFKSSLYAKLSPAEKETTITKSRVDKYWIVESFDVVEIRKLRRIGAEEIFTEEIPEYSYYHSRFKLELNQLSYRRKTEKRERTPEQIAQAKERMKKMHEVRYIKLIEEIETKLEDDTLSTLEIKELQEKLEMNKIKLENLLTNDTDEEVDEDLLENEE